MVDSYLSSPDPLANSIGTAPSMGIVTRRKSARLAPVKTPLPSASRTPSRAASESEGAHTVQLQNFVFDTPQEQRSRGSSPTRSGVKTENHLSPWRIRVTVEAERDGENDGAGVGYPTEADPEWKDKASDSPSGGTMRRTRTKTTKVPLKGLESSPPPPKRRGRPKKSETPVRPRNGTPVPKTRGRRKTAGGVSKGEDNNEDPNYLTPKRPAGRPRKRLGATEDDTEALPSMGRNDGTPKDADIFASPSIAKVKTTTKKTREKKKAKSPVRIAIDPDVQGDDEPENFSLERMRDATIRAEETAGDPNVNQASSALVSLSVNSIAMVEAGRLEEDFGEKSDGPTGKFSPAKKTPVKLKQPRKSVASGDNPASSNSIEHPEDPVPPESPAVGLSGELRIADNPGYPIGSGSHVGDLGNLDNSVLESEGFSMVSISSIASLGGYMSNPIPQESHPDNAECDLVSSLNGMNLRSPSDYGHPTLRHERESGLTQEEKWQLERYAVSRQIEMADSSQVIAIDSDNEPIPSDEGGECIDGEPFPDPDTEYQIYRSRILQNQERQLQEDCELTSTLDVQESKDLDDLFSNEDIRPRRGKIPSPWRADSQVTYSDEVTPDNDSDLLQPSKQEGQDGGEDGRVGGKVVDVEGGEGSADLSALLGLKTSPVKHPSRNSQSVGKSLRERLIEKFSWTKQETSQVEKPAEAKPMEVKPMEAKPIEAKPMEAKPMEVFGRLVLHPPSKPINHEGGSSKDDALPVLYRRGTNHLESQADGKKSVAKRRPHPEKRARQPLEIDEGFPTELHVGKVLGATTYRPSPPDAHTSVDDSTGSPTEQKPPILKIPSAGASDSGQAEKEAPSSNIKSTNATENTPADPTKWLKTHWKTLDEFWFASKKQRRLSPRAPTYTTGNLPFHCPGQRAIFLNDDEMLVAREFVMHMQRKNRGEVYPEFDEWHVAKRLYSMIIGEENRRRQGEEYDEEGRWVGYGTSKNHPKYRAQRGVAAGLN
ncbi:MAG: hypothetical protein M1813_008228 [Trichoglossum hirsutum]|nr:MAG: hypothetical protein M1813_008228 [Trichoglossum hirsutum]